MLPRAYPVAVEETYTQFPSLRALSSGLIPLSGAFLNPGPVEDGKVFPSLEHVCLGQVVLDGGDWNPLINFPSRPRILWELI